MLYKSIRVGKGNKPFVLYKLKTMRDIPGPPSTSKDDPRITPMGHILRRYKIDELPQLWNVAKGDMSLVGPRPEVPEVVALMSDYEKAMILSVKPGITDLASLWNFQEEERLAGKPDPHQYYLDHIWPEKKRLQMEYVRNKSLYLDLKIIWLTILKLLGMRERKLYK